MLTLTTAERVAFTDLLPSKGDVLCMTIARDLSQRVVFTAQEREAGGMTVRPTDGGSVLSWQRLIPDLELDLGAGDLQWLKARADELDKQKAVTLRMLPLVEKIRKA
jgi:hypothetical protein